MIQASVNAHNAWRRAQGLKPLPTKATKLSKATNVGGTVRDLPDIRVEKSCKEATVTASTGSHLFADPVLSSLPVDDESSSDEEPDQAPRSDLKPKTESESFVDPVQLTFIQLPGSVAWDSPVASSSPYHGYVSPYPFHEPIRQVHVRLSHDEFSLLTLSGKGLHLLPCALH